MNEEEMMSEEEKRRAKRRNDDGRREMTAETVVSNYIHVQEDKTPRNFLWLRGPQRYAHAGLHQRIVAIRNATPMPLETRCGRAVRTDTRTLDCTSLSRKYETAAAKTLSEKPVETSYGCAVRRGTRTLDCSRLYPRRSKFYPDTP